jgi:hydroxyacylglutathione hydrolase
MGVKLIWSGHFSQISVSKTMEQLDTDVWKLNVDSNVYLLELDKWTVIDTGPKSYKSQVRSELLKIIDLKKVERVIFTHLHYDHIGNFDLFPRAKFFASKEEIGYFKKNPLFAVGDTSLCQSFKVDLTPLTSLEGFDVIETPGHTRGSICLFYKRKGILFSGDTLFNEGEGRTDLPNSAPDLMELSLNQLRKLGFRVLAPGHDY